MQERVATIMQEPRPDLIVKNEMQTFDFDFNLV